MDKYQLLKPLTKEEYEALKADIRQRGVLVPVEKDENGETLDGHHRLKVIAELRAEGIKIDDPPVIYRVGMNEEEKKRHVLSLNVARRHLSKDDRNRQIIMLRQGGMSTRSIGEIIGVDHKTVLNVAAGENSPPDRIIGKDGKSQPSTKPKQPKSVLTLNHKDEEQTFKAIQSAGENLPDKLITGKRAQRIGREVEAENKRNDISNDTPSTHKVNDAMMDLRIGDFKKELSGVPSATVSLVLTDPPYGEKYLSEWDALSTLAADKLKPGGWLVAYSGQYHLDDTIASLSRCLKFVWIIALLGGSAKKTIIHHIKFYSRWKPILIFAKPPVTPLDWVNDTLNGEGIEKELHDWQQGEAEAEYLMSHFSKTNDLVVDPFLGASTNAVIAKQLQRDFIGCDLDAACIKTTRDRLL